MIGIVTQLNEMVVSEVVARSQHRKAPTELLDHRPPAVGIHDSVFRAKCGIGRKQSLEIADIAIVDREAIAACELAYLQPVFEAAHALLQGSLRYSHGPSLSAHLGRRARRRLLQ